MLEPIVFLAWDSKFFHRRVAKLILNTATSLDELLHSAFRERYELLYIYSHIQIEDRLIGRYVLLDVGGHITFTNNLSSESLTKVRPAPEIRELQLGTLTPELLEIAFLSGHLSRFKIDHSLPVGSFERLYENWLAKSLVNHTNTGIYTYEADDKPVGLATVDWNGSKCTIGLLAVLESYQGRGIATKLINYIKSACNVRKATSIEVKTQLSNVNARSLYIKNSFAEKDRSFLYHAHMIKQLLS